MTDVPDGSYKLRIFYYDRAGEAHGHSSDWLAFTTDVTVVSKGKANRTEVNAKVPALTAASGQPGQLGQPGPPGPPRKK
jgi:hypothetical protein